MASAQTTTSETLPLDDMRRRVRDLFEPRPALYWLDFLFHITLFWALFALAASRPGQPMVALAALLVCVPLLYRCVVFIHELAHLRRGTMTGFRWTWNLLCGFPMLLPSFTYAGVHNHHHRRSVYGTAEDGEYHPFASRPPLEAVGVVAASFLLPALLILRFVILTPLGWLSPPLRVWLREHASALTLEPTYRRTPSDRDEPRWRLQEALTFVYGTTALTAMLLGALPWRTLGFWYLVVSAGLALNAVRTLAAHRYRNHARTPMTVSEQFLDSVDIPGQRWLTGIWAPVGLRYHATHHLFPGMPYHNLGTAYRRLAQAYPDCYTAATRRSLLDALGSLWCDRRDAAGCDARTLQTSGSRRA